MRRFLLLLILISATTVAQQASTHPNFTGVWNVDLDKSNFGGLDAPQSARYLIRHQGAKLELQYEHDGRVTRADVTPDGEEHVLESNPDSENLARVYWSGPVLVFEGRIRPYASSNALPVRWTSRWTLSPDKKVLTIERHLSSERATLDQKVMFNKEVAKTKQ